MTAATIVQRKVQFFLLAIFGSAAIILLFSLVLYPGHQRLKVQRRKIAELEMALKEQQTLQPFYDDLVKTVNRKMPAAIDCPPLQALDRAHTREIASICEKIARQSDLKLATILPSVDDSDTMQVIVTFQGGFFQFRPLLFALARLPYLKRIDHFEVRSIENERQIELKLSIARS